MDLSGIYGNIHTVYIETRVNSPQEVRTDNPVVGYCVHSRTFTQDGGEIRCKQRFNPNPAILPAHYGLKRSRRECTSLDEYLVYRDGLLALEQIENKHSRVIRVDFKFDMADESQIDEWVKTCDVLIQAFVVKHHVTDKNNQTTTTHTGTRHKNAAARSGTLEIVNYNKAAQQESNGAAYRLELHALDTKGQSEEQVLRSWQRELSSLVAFYDEALSSYTNSIMQDWQTATGGTQKHLQTNQFVYANSSRLFARSQLKRLYRAIDPLKTDAQTAKAVANYCQRYKHTFVSYARFAEFVSYLNGCIDRFSSEKNVSQMRCFFPAEIA